MRGLVVFCVLTMLTASAQDVGEGAVAVAPEAIAEARSLFELGTRAVHEGRFRESEDALTRSLLLVARPATAFNLVVALRGMGAMVRASGVCERSLSGADLDAARAKRRRSVTRYGDRSVS